jgi:uncharacterized protein YoaH (UPF0181 family)
MKLISKQNDDFTYTPLCLTKRVVPDVIHRLLGDKVKSISTGDSLVSVGMTTGKPIYIIAQSIVEIGKGGNYLVQEKDTDYLIGICTANHKQELLDFFNKLGYKNIPYDYKVTKMKIL